MNIFRCLVCVDDMNFARHIRQHARVQDIEVLEIGQIDTRITRLFALLDVFERHLGCLGQKDVHVWKPYILVVLVTVHIVFFCSYELILHKIFPKHMARAE